MENARHVPENAHQMTGDTEQMGKVERKIFPLIQQLPGGIGIAAKDLDTQESFLYHEDRLFPAASIIKLPILVECLRRTERNEISLLQIVTLKEEEKVGGAGVLLDLHEGLPLTVKDLCTLMIVISDNTATNMIIDLLRIERIAQTMREIGMMSSRLERKLMIAPHLPTPNFTTPYEVMILLEKLWNGSLLSRDSTRLALDILSRQQFREKIPRFLPSGARVAHKTGELEGVRHDCGLLFKAPEDGGEPSRPPVLLCVMTEEQVDVNHADETIGRIARAVYDSWLSAEIVGS